MKLARRDLIKGGCTVAATALVPYEVDAWMRVAAPSSASNTQRTVINVPNQGNHYLNIAKSFAWGFDPSTSPTNSDGYPTSDPTTPWVCNPSFTLGYYDDWRWSWTGTASMQLTPPIIVNSGGAYLGLRTNTGDISGNATISSQTNPDVRFQCGWNIQSITSGPGGTIKIVVKTGWVTYSAGSIIPMQISGTASNTGANGIWNAVVIDNSSFYLQGTSFTNAQPSARGKAVFAAQAINFKILNGRGTLSGFSNLIVCRDADYTAVQAGSYWDGMGGVTGTTTLVGQLQDLMNTGSGVGTPGWLRFMDLSTVQGNFEKDWNQRTPVTAINWPATEGRWVADYWAGTFTRASGDAYSCSDPNVSVWGGSDYLEGAIVQGHVPTNNSGGTPKLAVGGHPAAPIIGYPPIPLIVTANTGIGTASIAATGSSYNSGTGVVTLNLSAALIGSVGVGVGDRVVVSGITGSGADLATLNNGGAIPYWTTVTGTEGTTVKFNIGPGLAITTITGGTVADKTAANGQSLSFTWSASGATWLNNGSNYTMMLPTRSSCTDGPTLGFHLEQCIMGSNDNNIKVPAILSGNQMTVCATAQVTGGSYVDSSGATTLTFTGPMDGGQYPSVGDSIIPVGITGTGGVSRLNGLTYILTSVAFSNSGGSTVVTIEFTAASGLGGKTTITAGGYVFDSTAAQPHPMVSLGRTISQNVVGTPTIASGSRTVWTLSVGRQTGGANFYNITPEPVLGFIHGSASLAVQVTNQSWFYTPCAQAGRLTATSLPSMFSSSTLGVKSIGPTQSNPFGNYTFIYSYLMKAWMAVSGPLGVGLPVEAAVQLCNTVGASYWNCILQPSTAYTVSYTNYVAANLSAGLKLGIEYGNENWNFTNPRTFLVSWGACLGWSVTTGEANLVYAGLRTKQYSDVIRAAWVSAGRSGRDFYMLSMCRIDQAAVGSDTDRYQNQGQDLNAAKFPLFAKYGGLGGGAAAGNYDAYPNRPIDACDAIGCAPYWGSPWWGGWAPYVNGTVSGNAPALLASLDFANGNTAAAFAACVSQFNGTTAIPPGVTPQANVMGSGSYLGIFTKNEAQAASYDGARQAGYNKLAIMHYEGGPQWGTGSNLPNGVNSVNATDIGALAAQIVSLQWDVSRYTQTGTPTIVTGSYNSGSGVVTLTLNSQVRNSGAAQITAQLYVQNNIAILEVSAIGAGTMGPGQTLSGAGVTTCTILRFFDNLGRGGNARWLVSVGQTVASQAMRTGDTVTITGLTGTGAIASLNGTFTTVVTTGGTTLSYQATTGLSLTINAGSGIVNDGTAGAYEVATNIQALGQAWKNDVSYKFFKTAYFQQFANISGINREIHPGQYGYSGDAWGLFPSAYSLANPYQNYYTIKEWNT